MKQDKPSCEIELGVSTDEFNSEHCGHLADEKLNSLENASCKRPDRVRLTSATRHGKNNSDVKTKTSTTRHKKKSPAKWSPAGIKPFLCLKGKLNSQNGAKSSPNKFVNVKAKIKKFESKPNKESPAVKYDKSNGSKMKTPSVGLNQVKRMLEVF